MSSVKVYNDIESKRSDVMNDDVLKIILQYLSVKEKLKLERCSQQFMHCVREVLSFQTGLKICHENTEKYCIDCKHSTYNANIGDAIVIRHTAKGCLRYRTFDVNSSEQNLKNILQKCPDIKCLELVECDITYDTIDWIWNKCPKIECFKLCLDTKLNSSVWERIGGRIGHNLIHLFIQTHRIENKALVKLIKKTQFLEQLTISCSQTPISELPLKSLSKLRKLFLLHSTFDENSVKMLSQLKNLTHLKVNTVYEDKENRFQVTISEHLMNLKSLSIGCIQYSDISALNKLENLENLEIYVSESFDVKYFDGIKSLISLTLNNSLLTPNLMRDLIKKFPKLRKLCLNNILWKCECANRPVDSCLSCTEIFLEVMKMLRVSYLQLYSTQSYELISKMIPNLINLNTIEMNGIYKDDIKHLINSIVNLANTYPKRVFKIFTVDEYETIPELPRNLKILIIEK